MNLLLLFSRQFSGTKPTHTSKRKESKCCYAHRNLGYALQTDLCQKWCWKSCSAQKKNSHTPFECVRRTCKHTPKWFFPQNREILIRKRLFFFSFISSYIRSSRYVCVSAIGFGVRCCCCCSVFLCCFVQKHQSNSKSVERKIHLFKHFSPVQTLPQV
jgi:hypothetical protein